MFLNQFSHSKIPFHSSFHAACTTEQQIGYILEQQFKHTNAVFHLGTWRKGLAEFSSCVKGYWTEMSLPKKQKRLAWLL